MELRAKQFKGVAVSFVYEIMIERNRDRERKRREREGEREAGREWQRNEESKDGYRKGN